MLTRQMPLADKLMHSLFMSVLMIELIFHYLLCNKKYFLYFAHVNDHWKGYEKMTGSLD